MKKYTDKEISKIAKMLAQMGGKSTLKKYGREHFRKMAQKRWAEKNRNIRKIKMEKEIK